MWLWLCFVFCVCMCMRAWSKACSSRLLSEIQRNWTHLHEKKEEYGENEKSSNNNNRIVNESKPQNIELNYNFTCINNQWESVLLSFLIDTNGANMRILWWQTTTAKHHEKSHIRTDLVYVRFCRQTVSFGWKEFI